MTRSGIASRLHRLFRKRTLTVLFNRLKKIGGVTDKRESAHACRHWYTIRFLLKGGKLFALQRHLGHEALEMVKIYAYITDQDAEDEKRKYSPVSHNCRAASHPGEAALRV